MAGEDNDIPVVLPYANRDAVQAAPRQTLKGFIKGFAIGVAGAVAFLIVLAAAFAVFAWRSFPQ